MTREEAKDYIREWCPYDRQEEIIKALEQEEPCNADTCKVVKAYMNEWDKPNNSDAIRRQAVLDLFKTLWRCFASRADKEIFKKGIEDLPPVNPQDQKIGEWIAQDIHNCHTDFKCSECGYIHNFMHLFGKPTAYYTYCPYCGCRMVEKQESEVEE